jgi:hypothetical protein
MRKLLVLALLAVVAYLAWQRFGPRPGPPASDPNSTPAANMRQRIDNRSGIAPE